MKLNLISLLPQQVKTIKDAETILLALAKTNKFYHLDDDPKDIEIFCEEECETLNRLIDEADTVTRRHYGMEEREECLAGIWEGLIKDLLPVGYLAFSAEDDYLYVYNDSKVISTTWASWCNMKLNAISEDGNFRTSPIDKWFRHQAEVTT